MGEPSEEGRVAIHDELRRLLHNPEPNESREIDIAGLDAWTLTCPQGAERVLQRIRDVLDVVLGNVGSLDTGDSTWLHLLPEWFVTEDPTLDDPWSVDEFLEWFKPKNRQWWWWSGVVRAEQILIATVEALDFPYAHEALEWLFRKAGATNAFSEMA